MMPIIEDTPKKSPGVQALGFTPHLARAASEGMLKLDVPKAPPGHWARLLGALPLPLPERSPRIGVEHSGHALTSFVVRGQAHSSRVILSGMVQSLRESSGVAVNDIDMKSLERGDHKAPMRRQAHVPTEQGGEAANVRAEPPRAPPPHDAVVPAHQLMRVLSQTRQEIALIFDSESPHPGQMTPEELVRAETAPYPTPVHRLPAEKMARVLACQQRIDDGVREMNALLEARHPVASLFPKAMPEGLLTKSVRESALNHLDQHFCALVPEGLMAKRWGWRLSHADAARATHLLSWRFDTLLKESADVRCALSGDWLFPSLEDREKYIDHFVGGLRLGREDKKQLRLCLMASMASALPAATSVEVGRELSRGGFGVVSQGLFGQRPVAVKRLVQFERDSATEIDLVRELVVQGRLHEDPNIPKVLGTYVAEGSSHIVIEQVKGGTMSATFNQFGGGLSRSERSRLALHFLEGAVLALNTVGQRGLIHRDLKPDNIMLDSDTLRVKLIDFGTTGPGDPAPFSGTRLYASLEQFDRRAWLTPQSDIYSLGSVLYEVLGGTLYPEVHSVDIAAVAKKTGPGKFNDRVSDGALWTPELQPMRSLIEACWSSDPLARPTSAQLAQALRGETVLAAADGQPGLKGEQTSVLEVLRPEHALRKNPAALLKRLLSP